MYSEDDLRNKSQNDEEKLNRSEGFTSAKEQELKILSPNKKFSNMSDYYVLTFNLRFLTSPNHQGSWINQFINRVFPEQQCQPQIQNPQTNNEPTNHLSKLPHLRAKFHKWIPMYSIMQWLNKQLQQHLEQGYLSEHSLWISLIDESQNYVHINLGQNLSNIAKKPYFNGNIEVLTYQAF